MSSAETNPLNISDKHKLLGLDHLRAFAITYVLLFHYQIFAHPAWVSKVGSFGWTGVDLFFVLSGFLIAGQLFNTIAKGNAISMREFFAKRFFRIIPPYLVMLGLYTAFPFLREREQMGPLWKYLTFTFNFGLDYRQTGTFTHSWSLCVEEQFYLVLPITFLLFNYFKAGKKAVYLLLVLFIGGFAIRYIGWHNWVAPQLTSDSFGATFNRFIYYPTYNRLDGLLIGVGIAGLYTFYPHMKERINKYSNIVMVAGLAILIAAYFVGTPQASFRNTIWGFPLIAVGYGLIVAAVVCPGNILYNAKSKVTSQIATLSYGIYLIHKLMIHVTQIVLEKAGIDKNSNLMMLCCLLSTIAGALVLRYAIEKPSLKLRNAVLKKIGK
ncbi:acyltransferase family protein [Mucilaginibacter sp. FT3.2]|uniref:acyltransferase family protein n=1 Tax=Mucilaginibacter sp. FT3.2 TaxID=2723090 RepID=UPI0017D63AAD|nr:peptidoglycan/LPS O-acetylase OafA/YrhL [Mucilaginibacter sp. FT3.2]